MCVCVWGGGGGGGRGEGEKGEVDVRGRKYLCVLGKVCAWVRYMWLGYLSLSVEVDGCGSSCGLLREVRNCRQKNQNMWTT